MNKADKLTSGRTNGASQVGINTIASKLCMTYTRKGNGNFHDDYVDGIIPPAEKKDFEEHLKTCPHCSRHVVAAIKRDERAEQSSFLSEQEQKRSLENKLRCMREIIGATTASQEHDIALAASPPRRLNVQGVSYGVAVNRKTGQGALLECIALVDDLSAADIHLEIIAKESITTTRDGVEIKVTPPTSYLEDLLKAMFKRHPLLKPFRLYKKAICVEINYKVGSGYIYESDSVALAVLIAILSAVTGKPVNKDILFSAGIKLNGYLEGVGDLKHKIQIAKSQRMKACYTADETRAISANKTDTMSGIKLHYFDTLEEVLKRLKLIEEDNTKKPPRRRYSIYSDKKS